MKKVLSIILALLMFASVLAVSATASSGDPETLETGEEEYVDRLHGTLPSGIGLEEMLETADQYTHRVILIGDTHRTPIYDFSMTAGYQSGMRGPEYAEEHGRRYQYRLREVMNEIVKDVTSITEYLPIEAVFQMGDLSSDNYGYTYHLYGENYVRSVRDEVFYNLPVPAYAVPGNHDSYPNDMWKEVLGYDRQYSVKIGDAAFIMLDVYEDMGTERGDGPWKGYDVEWLREEIKKYPEGPIFLCAHHVEDDEELNALIEENDRITLAFRGHSHHNERFKLRSGLTVFDVGSYTNNYANVLDNFTKSEAWGFGVLEWNDTEVRYYYVKTVRQYLDYYYPGMNRLTSPIMTDFAGSFENYYKKELVK